MEIGQISSVNITETPYEIVPQFTVMVNLNQAGKVKALLDSGSSGNFINLAVVKKLRLLTTTRKGLLRVTHVKGGEVGIVDRQVKCYMRIRDSKGRSHREIITLDVIPLGKHQVILGLPWLKHHEPTLDWGQLKPTFDSQHCQDQCLLERGTAGISSITLEELEIFEIAAMETNQDWRKSVPKEYHDFAQVFDLQKARKLPPLRGEWDFRIDLVKGAPLPPRSRPYRLTPDQMEEASKQLQELEDSGMIEDSTSPIAAPLFFVPKKDGTQRMVIDYRRLNNVTIKDAYPLPNMEELLEAARGAKVFSKFDLKFAYNLIRIRPEDKWKTAFITPGGLKQFTVLHYGFANAPACLQRYVNHALAPLLYKQPPKVSAYMDDAGTFAKDKKEAVALNRKLLKLYQKHGLFCNPKKCEFHKEEMELLGVVVNSKGFAMEDRKITAVAEWPRPTNLKQMKGFIGFCNFYRRFIKGFSIIARPLHELDKKGTIWRWGKEQEEAFQTLKKRITEEPCLAHMDPQKTFRMETDASNFAYGAALAQKQEDGKYHPVAFMSKSMQPAERNYDIFDKEALGVVKPLQHWRYWLQGTRKPIQVITDHKNLLTGFNDRPTPSRRHLRWVEALRHFNYVLGYRSGDKNSVADPLSRKHDLLPAEGELPAFKPFPKEKILPMEELDLLELEEIEDIALALVATDGDIQERIRKWLQKSKEKWPDYQEEDGLLVKDGRIWVPPDEDFRRELLELYHDSPFTGHLGITGTLDILGKGYYWENMQDYIRDYVTGCRTCYRAKKRNKKKHGTLNPLPVAEGPWLWTESDHIVKLPKSKEFDSIYVVVDRFTKMAHFIPCTEAKREEDIVELHLKHVWKHHGLPLVHSTDRHGNFTSDYVKKLFKGLGIEQRFSTAYHPQTQGQVENLNGWLETYLRMFCNHQKDNWATLLHMAEFAWNNHYHHSIKTTPFYANYGRHPVLTDRAPLEDLTIPARVERIRETQKDIEGDLHLALRIQKKQFDKRRDRNPVFEKGDKVYLEMENLITDEGSKKLSDKRTGPFEIIEKISEVVYRLRLPPHMKCHPIFNIDMLSKEKPDKIPGRRLKEPTPVVIEGDLHYEVEKIIDSNWYHGHLQYKVSYKGYDKEHDEWQFRDDLLEDMDKDTLEDLEKIFYKEHKEAPKIGDRDTTRKRGTGRTVKTGRKKKS